MILTKDIASALAGGVLPVRRCLASLCRGRIRMDHGAYPEDMETEDGYPSDARVVEIGCVSIRDARRWVRDVMPGAINALPCGSAEVEPFVDDFGKPSVRITVVTGGWSGVESIIDAVLDHVIMRQCLRETKRGGLYVFEVRAEDGPREPHWSEVTPPHEDDQP
jgi:hypothetical protein